VHAEASETEEVGGPRRRQRNEGAFSRIAVKVLWMSKSGVAWRRGLRLGRLVDFGAKCMIDVADLEEMASTWPFCPEASVASSLGSS